MSRFTGVFLRKSEVWAVDAITLNFMKELDSRLFHAGFGETRFRRFAFTVFKLTFFSGNQKRF